MRRKDEAELVRWLEAPSRKPLVIFRGARQVGKSTLVRQVAERVGLPIWEVNLERHAFIDEWNLCAHPFNRTVHSFDKVLAKIDAAVAQAA